MFLLWNIIIVATEAEINANYALVTSMTFMILSAMVLNSS